MGDREENGQFMSLKLKATKVGSSKMLKTAIVTIFALSYLKTGASENQNDTQVSETRTLKSVLILFRHGDRTPIYEEYLPKEYQASNKCAIKKIDSFI